MIMINLLKENKRKVQTSQPIQISKKILEKRNKQKTTFDDDEFQPRSKIKNTPKSKPKSKSTLEGTTFNIPLSILLS